MHPQVPPRPTIGVDAHPDGVRVRVDGDLDAADAPRLERVLSQVVDAAGLEADERARDHRCGHRVVVDLGAVDLLAAAAMTVLHRAGREAGRRGLDWSVVVSPQARRALSLTGLDDELLPRVPENARQG
ncbi:STAS domain-containing protein [Actinomycetospora atypica]|uniref:STAS domain-containing protein n=1 Tax=Actinomycetospora atypica TaxID=1290095 RepID=A0ABV9YI50_9PSEU